MILDILKTIVLGIVEGITEWLPISSTGHLIITEQFLTPNVFAETAANDSFMEMFRVVIQLGAILAVILLYFHKLNPFFFAQIRASKKAYLFPLGQGHCRLHSLCHHRPAV